LPIEKPKFRRPNNRNFSRGDRKPWTPWVKKETKDE
jgi:hypothetical protein